MAHVSVTIGGRTYRMACDDGQEAHLTGLAESLDARIEEMRAGFGEIGDMRLTVMAAVTLTDELAEARRRLAGLQGELDAARQGRAEDHARLEAEHAALTQTVGEAAERLERLGKAVLEGEKAGAGR